MQLKLLLALTIGALTLPGAVIYQQNFESASIGTTPAEFSGIGIIFGQLRVESTGGFSSSGLGANHLRNSQTATPTFSLTLENLAPHTTLTLSFDLIVWDSMDFGKTFGVNLDSNSLLDPTITSNYGGSPDVFRGPGTLLTPEISSFSEPQFGGNPNFRDQARRITNLTMNHTASTAVFTFYFGNSISGGLDESFGIDNIVISDNSSVNEPGAVPEPATVALTGMALGVLLWRKRR